MSVVNHTGICVTDVERSTAFYTGVFGFTVWRTHDAPDEMAGKLMGLDPPLGLHTVYLKLGSWVLELLYYKDRQPSSPLSQRTMDELGLTHVSVSVEDVDATAALAVTYGGSVIESSNIGAGVMIRDPDGQLIEVLTMAYADQVSKID
jgi:lactoylglutathione lyase